MSVDVTVELFKNGFSNWNLKFGMNIAPMVNQTAQAWFFFLYLPDVNLSKKTGYFKKVARSSVQIWRERWLVLYEHSV